MPVTKTAKRALRVSVRKGSHNKIITTRLEAAIRIAKKGKTEASVKKAMSLADQAAKKQVIHKNKAARIKSSLSKLLGKSTKKTVAKKKTSASKKKSSKK